MRALRLVTCPEEALKRLRRCFEGSPRPVKLLLWHYIYWLVRLERARRTENALRDQGPDVASLREKRPLIR